MGNNIMNTNGHQGLHVPFPRSYWVRPGLLLAGAYPGNLDKPRADEKLTALLKSGIRVVVNLMKPDETNWNGAPFSPYAERLAELAAGQGLQVSVIRRPIRDQGIPDVKQMRDILDDIDRSMNANVPLYVHCWGGKGRTGTVVGCHLVRHAIATGNDALEMIADLRRNDPKAHEPAPENKLQCDFVRRWAVVNERDAQPKMR